MSYVPDSVPDPGDIKMIGRSSLPLTGFEQREKQTFK